MTRLESDSVGELNVPESAYYGVQTLRCVNNFSITGRPLHPLFIKNMAKIKKASALSNGDILTNAQRIAIIKACDEIINGEFLSEFPVDMIQGGAGTSANMNANEVIANRAIEHLGGKLGDYSVVHPNDHVNASQSTNDVVPTAGKMTVIELLPSLVSELTRLISAFDSKASEFDKILKMGRTQLQEAVPIRLGQEMAAYASVLRRDIARINAAEKAMHTVNLGGSAIGTAINVPHTYLASIGENLSEVFGQKLTLADDLIDATQNLDGFVEVSAALKTCAVNLSKISNDLRLMSSGPRAGIGEINLPPKQNGSSIMPGKINPVIPEVVNQAAFMVIGNDVTVTLAAEAGQFELNAFEPVIFCRLFESITVLTNAVRTLCDNCVSGITANEEKCAYNLAHSTGIVTAMAPFIGYKRSAVIAKEALKTGVSVREIILRDGDMDEKQLDSVLDAEKMTVPAR